MKGAVLYGPKDIRFEHRDDPKIVQPTAAILRLAATSVSGSVFPLTSVFQWTRSKSVISGLQAGSIHMRRLPA
jgi:hypothetical protein